MSLAGRQVEIRLNVPYGGGPEGELCNDLYLPTGAGPYPALLCLHGGAWARGAPRQYQEWGPWLAARGYAVAAVDYRLSTEVSPSWPGVHEDVQRALRWLVEEAPALRVDPARLGLVGDSAGGHMATLLSLDDWVRPHVRAVVGVYGIYDLIDWWEVTQARMDDPVGKLMGKTPAQAPEDYRRFSPLQGVEAQGVPPGVPYLIIHGEQDPIVHHTTSPSVSSPRFAPPAPKSRPCSSRAPGTRGSPTCPTSPTAAGSIRSPTSRWRRCSAVSSNAAWRPAPEIPEAAESLVAGSGRVAGGGFKLARARTTGPLRPTLRLIHTGRHGGGGGIPRPRWADTAGDGRRRNTSPCSGP